MYSVKVKLLTGDYHSTGDYQTYEEALKGLESIIQKFKENNYGELILENDNKVLITYSLENGVLTEKVPTNEESKEKEELTYHENPLPLEVANNLPYGVKYRKKLNDGIFYLMGKHKNYQEAMDNILDLRNALKPLQEGEFLLTIDNEIVHYFVLDKEGLKQKDLPF